MDNEPSRVEETTTQFNLGQAQLQIIGQLMEKGSRHYLQGELMAWFFCWKQIKMQIVSRLSAEERDSLLAEEVLVNSRTPKDTEGSITQSNILSAHIERYETILRDLLEKKGFLVPSREDRSSLFNQADPDQD